MTQQSDNSILPKEEIKVPTPNKWGVVFHDDAVSTFPAVIAILQTVFHKSYAEANEIALIIHTTGQETVGVYFHEIAQQKKTEATIMARSLGQPLLITIEELTE